MKNVRRSEVIKSQPISTTVTLTGLYNDLRGKYHRHFCVNRDCRLFYEDACDNPEHNQICPLCRGATRVNAMPMDPVECCIGNCKQVKDRGVLASFKLAGPGPWYKCQTCARTHGIPCN